MAIVDIIIQNLIGGFIFTAVSLTITYFTIKFLIQKVMKELTSDEQKKKFGLWLQSVISNSLTYWLKDKKVKKLVLEILELAKDKLEKV